MAGQLAREHGRHVVLGARTPASAEETAQEIAAEGGSAEVVALDVTSDDSVESALALVAERHGRLDALVNNAGIMIDTRESAAAADFTKMQRTLDTNLFGAWRVTRAAIPLMEPSGGRIVNVSSGMGGLAEMGAGAPGYRVSKASLNAMTRILHAELHGRGFLVNSACPGWVRTDMGGSGAPRSLEEGADTPVWLATLPDGGPSGGFFRDRRPIPF